MRNKRDDGAKNENEKNNKSLGKCFNNKNNSGLQLIIRLCCTARLKGMSGSQSAISCRLLLYRTSSKTQTLNSWVPLKLCAY